MLNINFHDNMIGGKPNMYGLFGKATRTKLILCKKNMAAHLLFAKMHQWHIWRKTNTACGQKHKIPQRWRGDGLGFLEDMNTLQLLSTLNLSVYQSIAECLKKKHFAMAQSKSRTPYTAKKSGPNFLHSNERDWWSHRKNGYFKLLPLKVVLQATESWCVLSFIRLHRVLWKLSFSNDCRAEGIKDQSL